jgi:Endonuclease NucS C-terminal domain
LAAREDAARLANRSCFTYAPLARHTVEELWQQKYQRLLNTLANPNCWVDIAGTPPPVATVASPGDQSLSLLERDLQRVLARNLSVIEPGLAASPDYQLEEYQTDVGRIDLFCRDAQGKWVVVELKAGSAGDDAVGQVTGYMAWVRDNVPGAEEVRGILVCRNASDRVKAASRMVPGLTLKRYEMSFTVSPL